MSNPPAGCEEIREWLGAYVIRALEPGEDAPIEAHLALCAACCSERDNLDGVIRLLREAWPLPAESHEVGSVQPPPADRGAPLEQRGRERHQDPFGAPWRTRRARRCRYSTN
ncbi:zf-HC2 domain-containing protein [Streptomyces sp. DT190]|uniref:zf-HC2 domain-containing protein n=1 Tax=unclassified Streptomyces TaxID=2593676 RepID=UPI003CF4FCC1